MKHARSRERTIASRFFKQYELIYIAGDERDLIRVRTDFRKPQEDADPRLVNTRPEMVRKLFME